MTFDAASAAVPAVSSPTPTATRAARGGRKPAVAGDRLVYSNDGEPGIRRHRSGRGFAYRRPDGSLVQDRPTLRRIRSLVIPPAYADVWICADPAGHIQATGRDARGRKQYRYHPDWRAARDATKYARLAAFGRMLPAIRAAVDRDLRSHGLAKPKLVAAIVRLLESSRARIGNEEYAASNGSFGLTTLRKRHADVGEARILLDFKGKSGKQHRVALTDRRLARVMRACAELPGQKLFQYLDEEGLAHPVGSDDVNAYLREIAGEDFSAKDFRTWAGTCAAAAFLCAAGAPTSATHAKSTLVACMRHVAAALGNTPAVTRKRYVHPAVVAAYEAGKLEGIGAADDESVLRLLRRAERAAR